MSLQTIINNCASITFNRRKMVGIQYTRNEIPRISETPTTNPWRMTISMNSNLRYSEARSVIEAIDTLDRRSPEIVTFGNLTNMNWLFRYQGDMSVSQRSNLLVNSFVGNQLVLGGLPVIPATSTLFKANDLIQIGTYPYPFTSTTDVVRGTGSTVTVTTHRPNIISDSVVGLGLTIGTNCQFRVFCPNMPTYKLVPGGSLFSGTTLVNNAYITWSDDFEFYEYVGVA